MERLSELSNSRLAQLLNMTALEVEELRSGDEELRSRESEEIWQEAAKALDLDLDVYTGPSEEEVQAFWNLTVPELNELKFQRREPGSHDNHWITSFIKPCAVEDAVGRFRLLQDLLVGEHEFQARFPEAFELLNPRWKRGPIGLRLPSFDAYVLGSWTLPRVVGDYHTGADAYTLVGFWDKPAPSYSVGPNYPSADYDSLRGLLLAIFSREETGRIPEWPSHHPTSRQLTHSLRAPDISPVRLTDLRLAESLQPGILMPGMEDLLSLLQRPVSAENVVLWKLQVLGSSPLGIAAGGRAVAEHLCRIPAESIPHRMRKFFDDGMEMKDRHFPLELAGKEPLQGEVEILERAFDDPDAAVKAVSFTASALWLLLDLRLHDLQKIGVRHLCEILESLADVVRTTAASLNDSSEALGTLLSNRSAGRSPEPQVNYYRALYQHRMGKDLRQIAEWLGINPYSSKTGRGTRDWKRRTTEKLRLGKDFEERNFPRAALIFANRDCPAVRKKARRTFRGSLLSEGRNGHCTIFELSYWARTNKPETDRGREIVIAYAQLGSCLLRGIAPTP